MIIQVVEAIKNKYYNETIMLNFKLDNFCHIIYMQMQRGHAFIFDGGNVHFMVFRVLKKLIKQFNYF